MYSFVVLFSYMPKEKRMRTRYRKVTTPPKIKKGTQGSRGSWMPLEKLKLSHTIAFDAPRNTPSLLLEIIQSTRPQRGNL